MSVFHTFFWFTWKFSPDFSIMFLNWNYSSYWGYCESLLLIGSTPPSPSKPPLKLKTVRSNDCQTCQGGNFHVRFEIVNQVMEGGSKLNTWLLLPTAIYTWWSCKGQFCVSVQELKNMKIEEMFILQIFN